jgi:hypothetical protein
MQAHRGWQLRWGRVAGERLARPTLDKGDTVLLTEAPGGHRRTPYDPAFEARRTAARKIMTTRRAGPRGTGRAGERIDACDVGAELDRP